MDSVIDFATPARESIIVATDQGFKEWLKEAADVPAWFIETCFELQDSNIISMLKEKYWDQYCDELEFAWNAERQKQRSLRS